MQFTEIREQLSGERQESSCRLLERSGERLVLRHDLALRDGLTYLTLPPGSHCLAYYWLPHPYNAYHWVEPTGKTLGIALNLSGPTYIGDDRVQWRDLVVSVLLFPDQTLGYRVEVRGEDD
jgi:uncharacterized protein